MTSQRYRIVLNGAVAKGHDIAAVKRNLAKLFKTDAPTIDRVFSGRPVVIKQGLDAEQALQYISALAQAGAVGRMEAMPADAGARAAERRERQRRKDRIAAAACARSRSPPTGVTARAGAGPTSPNSL